MNTPVNMSRDNGSEICNIECVPPHEGGIDLEVDSASLNSIDTKLQTSNSNIINVLANSESDNTNFGIC